MRNVLSNMTGNKKIFIGDFDSYTIIKHNLSYDHLYRLAKVGMLLYDRIMLPAAFFWQSKNMQKLLLQLEPAILYGVVVPVIRDFETTTDVYDYYERRRDESENQNKKEVMLQPELASEIPTEAHRRYVKRMDEIQSYAHLDMNSIRNIYIENWCKDLDNPADINSLRLLLAQSNTSLEEYKIVRQLLLNEANVPHFSRSTCINRIQKLFLDGHIKEKLIERTSWLYLKSNADAYESGFYYSLNPYNGMIFEENLSLLEKTLSVLGLSDQVIEQLTVPQILNIRISPEYQRFIATYRDLIGKAYAEQESVVATVQQGIIQNLNNEEKKLKFCKALNAIQNISGTLFLGLIVNYYSGSVINNPLLITSGSIAAISPIISRIDAINKIMESRAFLDFKNYMLSQQYKNMVASKVGVSL